MHKTQILSLFFYSILTFSSSIAFSQNCEISDVFAEAYECDEDGNLLVDVTFNSMDTGNQGFTIRGNGVVYDDSLSYGESFYTIGPISGDCSTIYEFIVIDNANPDCNAFYAFQEPNCCNIPDCSISVSNIELGDCDSLGYRILTFEIESTTNSNFGLYFENALFVEIDNSTTTYSITVPGYSFFDYFTLRSLDDPSCSAVIDFDNETCTNYELCDVFQSFDIIFECTSDSTYQAFANFDYNGTNDSLLLILDNNIPVLFSAAELPVQLGEFLISNELYTFYIHEPDNVFCFTDAEWNDAPDCENFENCSISRVFAEAQECNDNGLFFVDVEFEYTGIGNAGFEIRGNGISYGDTFQYGQPFYTIGPLEGDCSTLFEFVVIDNSNPECNSFYEFDEPICCEDSVVCEIREIEVDSFSCNDDGTYSLTLNFVYEGNTNEFFDVWAGVEYIGFYSYNDLPITIDTFYSRDIEFDLIRVCDNDNDSCCTLLEFIGPNCEESQNCDISDVFAEAHECTSDSLFYVDIAFQSENAGSNGFEIRGNGVSYGDTFQYGQTFYTVGPLAGDCTTLYEFIVIDNDNTECNDFYAFDEPVCCGVEIECDIRDIEIDSFFCNGDGTYWLILDFIYEGNTNEFFDVWAGDEYVGFYSYDDLPIFIDTFYSQDTEFDLIRIYDNDNDGCFAEHEFIGPDCDENDICNISEVFAEPHECNDDGSFFVDITFEADNPGDLGFTIRGNGVIYESNLAYGQIFYTIGPLSGDCSTIYEFIIIDNANNDCNAFTGFEEVICCNDSNCEVDVIDIQLGDCDTLGNRILTFDVEHTGQTLLGFDICFGNAPLINFDYGAGPYRITIPGSSSIEYLLLKDQVDPNCQAEIIFENETCPEYEPCDFLFSPIERIFECTSDSTYVVYADVVYNGNSENLLLIFGEDDPVLFNVNELPILLGEFQISNELFTFYIHEPENVFCYTGSEWNDAPDCSGFENCSISNIFAEVQECDTSGLFYVDIEFDNAATGSAGFEIRGNGISYGDTFQYGQTFYTVGPLEGDCTTLFEFIVIDNDNSECNNFYVFEEPICCNDETECEIRDIEIDSFSCNGDGTYWLILDFIYEGNTNEFFDVWAGDEYIGFYSYDDLPVFIDTFYSTDGEYDSIRIFDNDNDGCFAELEFIGPECDDLIDSVSDRPIDKIDIYSNSKKLFIKTKTDINYSVSVYSLNGQLISQSIEQGDLAKSLNVNDGVYLIKIFDLKYGGYISKLLYF